MNKETLEQSYHNLTLRYRISHELTAKQKQTLMEYLGEDEQILYFTELPATFIFDRFLLLTNNYIYILSTKKIINKYELKNGMYLYHQEAKDETEGEMSIDYNIFKLSNYDINIITSLIKQHKQITVKKEIVEKNMNSKKGNGFVYSGIGTMVFAFLYYLVVNEFFLKSKYVLNGINSDYLLLLFFCFFIGFCGFQLILVGILLKNKN